MFVRKHSENNHTSNIRQQLSPNNKNIFIFAELDAKRIPNVIKSEKEVSVDLKFRIKNSADIKKNSKNNADFSNSNFILEQNSKKIKLVYPEGFINNNSPRAANADNNKNVSLLYFLKIILG